jgi:hypothetical protein
MRSGRSELDEFVARFTDPADRERIVEVLHRAGWRG